MSGTSSTTTPLDGWDSTLTPEQRQAYVAIGAALVPRKSRAWLDGVEAFRAGPPDKCPYQDPTDPRYMAWWNGWSFASDRWIKEQK